MVKKNTFLKSLYCDSAASMPIIPEVRQWLQESFHDPLLASWGVNLSSDHAIAQYFQSEYEAYTSAFFQTLQCVPSEWFWTSGATESNEWALQIAIDSCPKAKIIAIHPLAHPSLALAAKRLAEKRNLQYLSLPLRDGGSFYTDFEVFQSQHNPKDCIVAMPYGDHEMGIMDPYVKDFKECAWLHFDAAQSFGKVPGNFRIWPCTSLACSSAKIGALSGLGGLFIRLRPKKIMNPLFVGGSQQNALRAGTLPYFTILTFYIAYQSWKSQFYAEKIQKFRKDVEFELQKSSHIKLWSSASGLPHICTLELSESRKESIMRLKSVLAFSQGSACQQGQGSLALQSVGFSLNRQRLLMRLGFSPYNLTEFEELLNILRFQLAL